MPIKYLLLFACLLAVVLAGKKTNSHKQKDKEQPSGPTLVYLPVQRSGSDHVGYTNGAPHNNLHSHKNAEVRLNRFPGGVSYSTNEEGYGANVKVNFHTYPSRTQSYGHNQGGY